MQEFKQISSKDNPIIKHISKLQKDADYRKNTRQFIAEGLRFCVDCVDNGIIFDTLVLSEKFIDKKENIDKIICNSKEVIAIKDYIFDKISDTKTPQGIIGVAEIPYNKDEKLNPKGRYIALENIADPSNLGAVSRTAEALGIDGIIISSNSCDPYSPKSLRASMGTLLRMPIFVFDNFISEIKESKLSIYPCVVSGGANIKSIEFLDGSIVLIGNEANGLSKEAADLGTPVTIKMSGNAESLNASAAAAIAMWELKK